MKKHLSNILSYALLSTFVSTANLNGQESDNPPAVEMSGKGLEAIIRDVSEEDSVTVAENVIEFTFEDVSLICIYDEAHNRMRIVSPILNYSLIPEEGKDEMMRANFHAALDARYCVSGDILFAAFIHPLSTLERGEVLSAIYQVASLHLSFGTSYTSGLLSFGGEEAEEEAKDAKAESI